MSERDRPARGASRRDRPVPDHASRAAAAPDVRPDLPVHRCARCGRPFADESLLALHRGLAHAEDLDEDEAEAFRTAYDEEDASLRRLRLFALVALVVLYFGLLATYAAV